MSGYIQCGPYKIIQPKKENMMKRALWLQPYVQRTEYFTNDKKVPYSEIEGLLTRLYQVQYDNLSRYVQQGISLPSTIQEFVSDEMVAPEKLTGKELIDLGAKQPDGVKMKQLAGKYSGIVPYYLQDVNAYYLHINGNDFVHIFTNKVFGMPSESSDVRLYLNLQAENTVEFARIFMNTCRKTKNSKGEPMFPYYKFAGRHRYDQFIVYASYANTPYYIQVLEQIKKSRPDLCVGTEEMSETWGGGSINGWIGFGENVAKKYTNQSYTSLRDSAEYKFRTEVKKMGLKWGDGQIVELYDRCMEECDIDPNNYTLNLNSPLKSKIVTTTKK